MAFAPYSNDRRPENMPVVLGSFREVDHGHLFEYAERSGFPSDFYPDMPHVMFVGPNGETRLANVKKTVLTMVNGDGQIEKWMIKQHRVY